MQRRQQLLPSNSTTQSTGHPPLLGIERQIGRASDLQEPQQNVRDTQTDTYTSQGQGRHGSLKKTSEFSEPKFVTQLKRLSEKWSLEEESAGKAQG